MSTAIELTAGTLPPPACYATEQERHNAYTAAIVAELVSDPEWIVSATEPAPDENKHWLRLDTVTLRPIGAYDYVVADAAWVPWLWFSVTPNAVGGAANAYTITNTPAFTTVGEAYSLYRTYKFLANFSTTGASTLNVDGLGAKAIKVKVSEDTGVDTIKNGQIVEVVYDGTNFQMVSAVGAAATIAVSNLLPGTDRQFLRTVGTVASWETSLYSTPSGSEAAIPAANGSVTFAHGLGVKAKSYGIKLVCIDSDIGWSAGDEFLPPSAWDTDSENRSQWAVFQTTTEVGAYRITNDGDVLFLPEKTTGILTQIDPTKWKIGAWAQI